MVSKRYIRYNRYIRHHLIIHSFLILVNAERRRIFKYFNLSNLLGRDSSCAWPNLGWTPPAPGTALQPPSLPDSALRAGAVIEVIHDVHIRVLVGLWYEPLQQ